MSDKPVPVVWHEGSNSLDKRSRYGIATLLNETFDAVKNYEFVHYSTMRELPQTEKRAVIIIHGTHEYRVIDTIQQDVNGLEKSLIINIGDEGAEFPTRRLIGSTRKIWVQMPVPGRHDYASHFLVCGYPHDAKMHLAVRDARSVNRPLDWFFSGQVQHQRRRDCVAQLSRLPNGLLNPTPGFWQGLERSEYYRMMSDAKIIPCPAGSVTPDTIRMAEALEAGCVPIVDGLYAQANRPDNYWQYVLGENPPFPIIYDWKDFPRILAEELKKWPANRDRCIEWWTAYKLKMVDWMTQDIKEMLK